MPEISPAKVQPAKGAVGFVRGCVMSVMFGDTNAASVRLLNEVGFDVVVPREQECCGALFAHMSYLLHPNEFGFLRSVELVVMVTLGGLGSISGAIVTAAVLTLLPEMLRGFSEWRMILYSLLLIVMMLVRPQGLLGSREIWPFGRRGRGGRRKPAPPPPTKEPVSAAP